MESINMKVSISPIEAAKRIVQDLESRSSSCELVDRYESRNDYGQEIIVLVFEKFYMRNSSRASLTVTLENLRDVTQVHAIGSGGGQGLFFKFDWGASNEFSSEVLSALSEFTYRGNSY